MSAKYKNAVARYLKMGIYTVDDCREFVKSGNLTEKEFEEITGEEYSFTI